MKRIDDLFYKSKTTGQIIEGYLGDDTDPMPEVLFIMKEPHIGVTLLEFWHPSYSYINYDYLYQAVLPIIKTP